MGLMQPPCRRPGEIYRLVQVVFEISSAIQQELKLLSLTSRADFSAACAGGSDGEGRAAARLRKFAVALNEDVFDIFPFMPR